MADDKQWQSLPWSAIIGVAGTAISLYLAVHGVTTSRPGIPSSTVAPGVGDQTVSARLWQDPLTAIPAPALGKAPDESINSPAYLAKRISTQSDPPAVVCVMLPSSPYAEDGETRIRVREAVLSGLGRVQFVPENGEHLGYCSFEWPSTTDLSRTDVSTALPKFPATPTLNRNKNLVLIGKIVSLVGNFFGAAGKESEINTVAPEPSGEPARLIAPFEWWRPQDQQYTTNGPQTSGKPNGVLVLWLPEGSFGDRPLKRIALLAKQLFPNPDFLAKHPAQIFRVIGPYSSTTLRSMCTEAIVQKPTSDLTKDDQKWLSQISMISASATAGGDVLDYDLKYDGLRNDTDKGVDVPWLLTERGHLGSFQRSAETDDKLASALIEELRLRGIDPRTDHIALITEWDTLYGRALPLTFEKVALALDNYWPDLVNPPTVPTMQPMSQLKSGNFIRYSYLRGIDGKLPGDEPLSKSTDDSNTSRISNQPQQLFDGRDQSDYLLRLADDLSIQDLRFRRDSPTGRGIRAIGVLGSDIYDKLMVLQALRGRFPGCVFFTTDLDARYWQNNDVRETRGLIVAAPFGLQLSWKYQGEISPFRDSYQTSFFLATIMALDKVTGAQPSLNETRLFEIGRHGAVDLSAPVRDGPGELHPSSLNLLDWICWRTSLWSFGLILATVAMGVLFYLSGLHLPRPTWKQWWSHWKWASLLRYWYLAAPLYALVAFGVIYFIVVCAGPNEEPLSMTSGISIWPTTMIRVFVALMSVHLLLLGAQNLQKNEEELALKFSLPTSKDAQLPDNSRLITRWILDPSQGVQARKLWAEYLGLASARSRAKRVSLSVVSYVAFVLCACFLFGFPDDPARGPVSRGTNFATFLLAIVPLSILTLFALDALRLCQRVILNLGAGETEWPSDLTDRVTRQRDVPRAAANILLDIQFIASRSEVITPLIYYPSVLIALLVLARSSYFADWDWPWSIIFAVVICFVATIICCILLLRSAAVARKIAIKQIDLLLTEAPSQAAPKIAAVRKEIAGIRQGAFATLAQMPAVNATLIPVFAAVIGYLYSIHS